MSFPVSVRPLLATLAGLLPLAALSAQPAATAPETLAELVAPGAEAVEVTADGKFTEGPAQGPDGLYYSDIPNERIVRVDAAGKQVDFLTKSGRANGLVFDARGYLYACQGGGRKIVRLDPKDAKKQWIVVDHFEGKKLNSPNDLALDGHGGLYFTDPRYGRGEPEEQPVRGVYYVQVDGRVRLVVKDFQLPNGVNVSRDGKWLYVAANEKGEIWRYAIQAPGELSKGTLFFRGDPELDGRRGPDGMSIDENGNLYATYNAVTVIAPDGKMIGRIPVPKRPSNCSFGGKDGRTLFVTARTHVYSLGMKVRGQPLRPFGPDGVSAERRDEKLKDLVLSVPKSWRALPSASSFRLGQFEVPGAKDETPAELVVFWFNGNLGGAQANVERWIGQVQGARGRVTEGQAKSGEYVLCDLSGTYKQSVGPPRLRRTKDVANSRVVNVFLPKGDGTFSIRLAGAAAVVGRALPDLRAALGLPPTHQEKTIRELTPPKAPAGGARRLERL